MDSVAALQARRCIETMRNRMSDNEFGYKVQALAAHVLLRLDYEIVAINHSGHPDIIATLGGKEFRFEVEAQAGRPRVRKLGSADLKGLVGTYGVFGYYALAVPSPVPNWILVPVAEMAHRKRPAANALLRAISNKSYSHEWTTEYLDMLYSSCRRIRLATFNALSEMALAGTVL